MHLSDVNTDIAENDSEMEIILWLKQLNQRKK